MISNMFYQLFCISFKQFLPLVQQKPGTHTGWTSITGFHIPFKLPEPVFLLTSHKDMSMCLLLMFLRKVKNHLFLFYSRLAWMLMTWLSQVKKNKVWRIAWIGWTEISHLFIVTKVFWVCEKSKHI